VISFSRGRSALAALGAAALIAGGWSLAWAHRGARPPARDECSSPAATWLWCDDFERDRLRSYFEYNDGGGRFVRTAGAGRDGSWAMRVQFGKGQVSVGALHLAFGRTPQPFFRPVHDGDSVYRDIYWRFWLRLEPGWTGGGGNKLTRAIGFASETSWAESMIAHVWSGVKEKADYLVIDPASGTDAIGILRTTTYNDFDRLRWLGAARGARPLFDAAHVGTWQCIEAHARLNTPGRSDGVFELWVNDTLSARRQQLDWVGGFDRYGINAVYLENYWNGGAPADVARDFDEFVVATARIGCGAGGSTGEKTSASPPNVGR
jgi:hypothetical protein